MNLAFHKSRPMTRTLPMKDVPAIKVFERIPDFCMKTENIKPEVAALRFYSMNHAWGLIQLRYSDYEDLGPVEQIADAYHVHGHNEVLRMFYYLLIICTRESRHVHKTEKLTAVWTKYPQFKEFHGEYVDDASSNEQIKETCLHVPNVTMGEYAEWLVDMFKCSYSSGFGGAAWRVVAECARDFIFGKISAEMMMDTAFTLAHNNGPIFNKGMLFDMYGKDFIKLLDIQASGQIPSAVVAGIVPFAVSVVAQVEHIATQMEGYVTEFDWDKLNQNAKGGPYQSPNYVAPKASKSKTATKTPFQWMILPDLSVDIVNRKDLVA